MAEKIADMRLSYIGHRHVTRILSDYYGRGIVRSSQESTNLRAYSRSNDVTAAECIKTNKNVVMPAAEALFLIEKYNKNLEDPKDMSRTTRLEVDLRDPRHAKIVSKNTAYLYAMRPLHETERAPELKFLSLYDFSATGGLSLLLMRCRMQTQNGRTPMPVTPS